MSESSFLLQMLHVVAFSLRSLFFYTSALRSRYTCPDDGNDICGISRQFGGSCDGLKLINPGVNSLQAGQVINVPPCNT